MKHEQGTTQISSEEYFELRTFYENHSNKEYIAKYLTDNHDTRDIVKQAVRKELEDDYGNRFNNCILILEHRLSEARTTLDKIENEYSGLQEQTMILMDNLKYSSIFKFKKFRKSIKNTMFRRYCMLSQLEEVNKFFSNFNQA